jgi:hypothetical protein
VDKPISKANGKGQNATDWIVAAKIRGAEMKYLDNRPWSRSSHTSNRAPCLVCEYLTETVDAGAMSPYKGDPAANPIFRVARAPCTTSV